MPTAWPPRPPCCTTRCYYLPSTTTLRAGLGADVDVTPWLSLGASAAANYWLGHEDQHSDALILPLNATATLRWAHAWSAHAGYRGLLRWLDPLGLADRTMATYTKRALAISSPARPGRSSWRRTRAKTIGATSRR